jgi:ribosomal protein L12E/L44/L45/RPP1/RPP2
MRHIAAYLLLQIGGNASPSAADIKKVLDSVGIEADEERLTKLVSELQGKDVNSVRILSYTPFEFFTTSLCTDYITSLVL